MDDKTRQEQENRRLASRIPQDMGPQVLSTGGAGAGTPWRPTKGGALLLQTRRRSRLFQKIRRTHLVNGESKPRWPHRSRRKALAQGLSKPGSEELPAGGPRGRARPHLSGDSARNPCPSPTLPHFGPPRPAPHTPAAPGSPPAPGLPRSPPLTPAPPRPATVREPRSRFGTSGPTGPPTPRREARAPGQRRPRGRRPPPAAHPGRGEAPARSSPGSSLHTEAAAPPAPFFQTAHTCPRLRAAAADGRGAGPGSRVGPGAGPGGGSRPRGRGGAGPRTSAGCGV